MKKIFLFIGLISLLFTSCDTSETPSNEMIGAWKWESTCGGFVGCVYPSVDNQTTLRISETEFIMTTNGAGPVSKTYQIVNRERGKDLSTIYKVGFSDGSIDTFSVSNRQMSSGNSIVITSYKKIL